MGFALVASSAAAQDEPNLDSAFKALAQYAVGSDSRPLESIIARINESHRDGTLRKRLESGLLDVIASENSTRDGKQFAAKQLYRIGSSESVPRLAPLLLDAETSDMVRYALEKVPGDEAQEALLNALTRTRGLVRAGVAISLGERGDASAVQALRRLSGNGDPRVMRAAITALGKIGGQDAADAVLWCSRNIRADLRGLALEAYLRCADSFAESGDIETATDMYRRLNTPSGPRKIRLAAFQGRVKTMGEGAADLIVEALNADDPTLSAAAIDAARTIPGPAATSTLAAAIPSLPNERKPALIRLLGERGGSEALPEILRAHAEGDAPARLAAIEALGAIGGAPSVTPLLESMTSPGETERDAALVALSRLASPGVDSALNRAVMSVRNPIRIAAMEALAGRRATSAIPLLLRSASRDAEVFRLAALKALGVIGGEDELAALVEIQVGARTNELRNAAERASVSVAKRMDEGRSRTRPHLSALRSQAGRERDTRASLVRALGQIADDSGVSALESEARKGGEPSRGIAIRALAQWPSPRPIDALAKAAETSEIPAERSAAFGGFIRLLRLDSDRPSKATIKYYARAIAMAETSQERKQILAGLAEVPDTNALDLVAPFLDDPEVGQEARLAQARIMDAAGAGR